MLSDSNYYHKSSIYFKSTWGRGGGLIETGGLFEMGGTYKFREYAGIYSS